MRVESEERERRERKRKGKRKRKYCDRVVYFIFLHLPLHQWVLSSGNL